MSLENFDTRYTFLLVLEYKFFNITQAGLVQE